ncbi:IS200/IS605 family transposase [Micromonospora sp. DR5-3]|uniref:IS200/IS605 family transposase n=1 Tax=unclassified Micromonospora TaxID=2617518 RepID=UPI001CA34A91|nr:MULTISPECIES: IS200/IS605 family transposase [unclassified Micromonospora]MCW3815920.1 IS200/IS605 family transposase [Micromonospora sp. DR5-3]
MDFHTPHPTFDFITADHPVRPGWHCTFPGSRRFGFRSEVFGSSTTEHLHHLERVTRQVCEQFECELLEFDGDVNHVHLLVGFPPNLALSKVANSLKGVSSRYLRRSFPEIRRYYWRAPDCGPDPTSPALSEAHH